MYASCSYICRCAAIDLHINICFMFSSQQYKEIQHCSTDFPMDRSEVNSKNLTSVDEQEGTAMVTCLAPHKAATFHIDQGTFEYT